MVNFNDNLFLNIWNLTKRGQSRTECFIPPRGPHARFFLFPVSSTKVFISATREALPRSTIRPHPTKRPKHAKFALSTAFCRRLGLLLPRDLQRTQNETKWSYSERLEPGYWQKRTKKVRDEGCLGTTSVRTAGKLWSAITANTLSVKLVPLWTVAHNVTFSLKDLTIRNFQVFQNLKKNWF